MLAKLLTPYEKKKGPQPWTSEHLDHVWIYLCNVPGTLLVLLWKACEVASYPLTRGQSVKANKLLVQFRAVPTQPADLGA